MSSPYVHTDLSLNTWEATGQSPPIYDNKAMLDTVRIPVTFRGSLGKAVQEFKHGAQNCPHGGDGMFCLGPSDITLVPNSGADPHWDIMVEWIGLHSGRPHAGGSRYDFKAKIDWSHRAKTYPEEIPLGGGSDPVVVAPGYPFAPSGTGTGGAPRKSKHFDHLATATIDIAMNSTIYPNPGHPYLRAILARLPTSFPGVMQDYTGLTDPTWVTWVSRPAPRTLTGKPANPANWFPGQIQINDRISSDPFSGPALHLFTVTATLEQLLQPTD